MRRTRLDAVLRVRRLQEERAKGDLLHAQSEELYAVDVARGRRTALEALPPAPTAVQSPAAFLTDRAVRTLSAGAVVAAVSDARLAAEHREGRHGAWSHAAQQAGAVERLESRHREARRLEGLRAEQAAADEVALGRWGREIR